jgi:hypothetical protein
MEPSVPPAPSDSRGGPALAPGLFIEPDPREFARLASLPRRGTLQGRPLREWRRDLRQEVGIPAEGRVIATGHQTLLWHAGILAKFMLVDAMRRADAGFVAANLVIDQHTGDFDRFDVPVRRADGLAVQTIALTEHRPDVPMGAIPAFTPAALPEDLATAIPSAARGARRIVAEVAACRGEPNAALQMASALERLMAPWVAPMPRVAAGSLLRTSLGRAILARMAEDPAACARLYNEAVESVPQGGIGSLEVASGEVELPLWHLGPADRRLRATDRQLRGWLTQGTPRLFPRALLTTALVRLGLCDLFVHGTGGAAYDLAMERWIWSWLELEPAPAAVATATLYLPLMGEGTGAVAAGADVSRALDAVRRLWHDPAAGTPSPRPSPQKLSLLRAIDEAPRRSRKRRRAFQELQGFLERLRGERADEIASLRAEAQRLARLAAALPIARRRDWAFPLYPQPMIDALAWAIDARVGLVPEW